MVTLGAELKPIAHVSCGLLNQAAALGVDFSCRTNGVTLLDVDLKLCGGETAIPLWSEKCWPDELAPFGLGLNQLVRRNVSRVHIQYRGLLQSHLRLLLFHLQRSSFIALISWMGQHADNKITRRFAGSQSCLADCLGDLHFVTDVLPLLLALAFD